MNILKIGTIVSDIGIIIWLVAMAITGGVGTGQGWLFLFSAILLMSFNIYLIVSSKRGGEGWVSLFFKRKALEEEKRIADLDSKK